MKRRICSLLLILFLLAELWIPASASSSMTTSSDGKAFIKEQQAGQSYDLAKAEDHVNSFMDKYGLSLKQHQFDALVDLAAAYPSSKILSSDYNIEKVLGRNSYTDAALASAFTAWVKDSSGNVSAEKLNRRLREVKLFLYGSYDGNCEANFRYVLFNPNGGNMVNSNLVLCYTANQSYESLPVASHSSKYFAGWYTTASSGDHIHNATKANSNRTVYAHWSSDPVSTPNVGTGNSNNSGISLKTSEACIAFLKETEGFRDKAYEDNGQYSIGYGTRCGQYEYPNGITREYADYLLRKMLADFEVAVDKFLSKASIQHTQNQYDAIMSFTFNLGYSWMNSNYNISKYILYGYPSEEEFINTMGAWANSGGGLSANHMRRRMDEANMYLNGSYKRFSTTYTSFFLKGNGGTIDYNNKTEGVYYCRSGEPMGTPPGANRNGYKLKCWTNKAGTVIYSPDTIAPVLSTKDAEVVMLYAKWEKESTPPPTEPPTTEPPTTEPPTTEPPTTEPPTTEPPQQDDPAAAFKDISNGDWFYPYVSSAVEKGLLNGMSETSFGPNQSMTRSMVVTVLHRLAGSPEPTGSHPFTDVNPGRWYTNAVIWAYENSIVNGMDEDTFGTKESVSRQQLVTMLHRFAQYRGMDVSQSAELDSYSDAKGVSSYAKAAFRWAVAAGIINGSDGKLLPYGAATRAQCAKIMVVFSELQG